MTKPQEFIDLIDELNDKVANNKYLENLGINFSYSTNGWSDAIKFGGFTIYCSENDCLSKYDVYSDEEIDMSLKEFVINSYLKLAEELSLLSENLKQLKL